MRVGCLLLVFSTKACGMIVNLSVHRLAMVPNSEIQWYLLAMTRDAPCGQVVLPGLFWVWKSRNVAVHVCNLMCFDGFWEAFESAETCKVYCCLLDKILGEFWEYEKKRKKELYFLLRCVTEISVVVVCVYACKPGYCVFKTLKDFESVKVCKCNVLWCSGNFRGFWECESTGHFWGLWECECCRYWCGVSDRAFITWKSASPVTVC